jgi:glycosyltransferase involved in cell wall biosynthesis
MEENNYDLVHAHGTRAASNVFYSCGKLKLPMLYTVHGWSFHDGQRPLVRRFRELSEKFLTNKADLTIAVSNSNQQDGITKFGMKRSTVIYNGIDEQKFNSTEQYPDIRKEFGIPADKTVVGYLVRMTYQKDPFTMIRAIKSVCDREKNIIFLMVGNGDLLQQTKKLASDLGVSSSIIFSDFRKDIPAILHAIDIYCLPSLWEGMPIGLLEAMAMGKACVATGVDGTMELINSNQNGILVPVKNHGLLANAILELHQHPEKRNSIGWAAKEFVKEKFSLSKMVDAIETQYLHILQSKAGIEPL